MTLRCITLTNASLPPFFLSKGRQSSQLLHGAGGHINVQPGRCHSNQLPHGLCKPGRKCAAWYVIRLLECSLCITCQFSWLWFVYFLCTGSNMDSSSFNQITNLEGANLNVSLLIQPQFANFLFYIHLECQSGRFANAQSQSTVSYENNSVKYCANFFLCLL